MTKNISKFILAFLISGVTVFTNLSVNAASSSGDLDVFAQPDDGGASTLLFMIETSSFMWSKDADLTWNPTSWINGTVQYPSGNARDPYHNINYKRWGYSTWQNGNKYNRITRLKDMIFYLMTTEGALPGNLKIAVGRYQASPKGSSNTFNANTGSFDSVAGGIFIPADYINGDPTVCKNKDATIPSNKCGMYSEQRRKIKQYVADICAQQASCIGESPMAWAYAEAGAYMMNTKTAPLLETETVQNQLAKTFEQTRFRRKKIGGVTKWQVCPKSKQILVNYVVVTSKDNYRVTCLDGDWEDVTPATIGNYTAGGSPMEWGCQFLGCYGYTWRNSIYPNSPKGIGETLSSNKFQFWIDTPTGSKLNDGWTYYYDNKNPPNSINTPGHDAVRYPFKGSGVRNAPLHIREGLSYQYKDPNFSECSGTVVDEGLPTEEETGSKNGIIFFTSGFNRSSIDDRPLLSGASNYTRYNAGPNRAENVMNMSLTPFAKQVIDPAPGHKINCNAPGTLDGSGLPLNNKWHCIGHYAKRLNSKNNPTGKKIKTGVVLFGATPENIPYDFENDKIKMKNGIPQYDCDGWTGAPKGVKNACFLGSEAYGDGGFIRTTQKTFDKSTSDLVKLIKSYQMTEKSNINLTPLDAPTIPIDPFYPNALQKNAYLPLIYPDVYRTSTQWQGNLRKYIVSSNGIVDKNNNNPYAVTGRSILSHKTLDLWSAASTPYVSREQGGGVYEKRPYPVSGSTTNIRPVFIEDINTVITSGSSGLISLKPISDASIKNKINSISAPNIADPANNTDDFRKRLLNFLGYNIADYDSTATDNASILQTAASTPVRSYAGVMHSKPLAVTYELTKNSNDEVDDKESYMIFGATDNALHVVDDETGIEKMVFIPRAPLADNGYKALSPNGFYSGVNHGVDAPWESDVNYEVSFNSTTKKNKVKAKSVKIYGGLRLGGERYYGLDITRLTQPKLLFNIGASANTFKRMAYTWAKPVKATIKWGYQRKKVLIVPGGYDRAFDKNSAERRATKSDGTRGNALYIIDADNGKPLMSFGRDLATSNTLSNVQARGYHYNNQNLLYSVVGAPKTLDRDADGLVDHIYFADLAGQVFRVDLNNGVRAEQNTKMQHFVRVADFTDAFGADQAGPRFFETPVVTIHKHENKRFAVISVASGDRSNPGFKNSEAHTDIDMGYKAYNNKLFAIFDKDVARKDLFTISDNELHTKDVTLDYMTSAPDSSTVIPMMSTTTTSSPNLSKRIEGWYYDLNRYGNTNTDGSLVSSNKGKHLKAYGPLAAIDNDLYVSVYNFHDNSNTDKCSAYVKGKTEANVFCLPFGYCTDDGATKKYVQRFLVGRGISPVTFGALDDKGLSRTVITQNPANGKVALEQTGKDLDSTYGFNYYLRPTRWFDLTHQKK